MQKIILASIFCLLASGYSLACLMAQGPEPPRSIVNPRMYILVGEIVGYTEPVSDPNNFRGEAVGLIIKPLETISFPHFKNDYVEVFMFHHGPDCFPISNAMRPPLGAKYRFALYPARLVASMRGSYMRLESRVFDRIGADEAMFGYSTLAKSEFDYQKHLRTLVQKFSVPEMMEKRRWLNDFLYIETSKDLLRFQRAYTEEERMELLERLLYCPDINYRALLYSKIGQPLLDEADYFQKIFQGTPKYADRKPPRKLSKDEHRLLNERNRLEASGELNIWN